MRQDHVCHGGSDMDWSPATLLDRMGGWMCERDKAATPEVGRRGRKNEVRKGLLSAKRHQTTASARRQLPDLPERPTKRRSLD